MFLEYAHPRNLHEHHHPVFMHRKVIQINIALYKLEEIKLYEKLVILSANIEVKSYTKSMDGVCKCLK